MHLVRIDATAWLDSKMAAASIVIFIAASMRLMVLLRLGGLALMQQLLLASRRAPNAQWRLKCLFSSVLQASSAFSLGFDLRVVVRARANNISQR